MAFIVPYHLLEGRISTILNAGNGLYGNFSLKKGERAYVPFFGIVYTFENLQILNKWNGQKKKKNVYNAYFVDTVDPLKKIYGIVDGKPIISALANMSTSRRWKNNAVFCYFTEEERGAFTETDMKNLESYPYAVPFMKNHFELLTFLEITGPFKKAQEILCDYNPGSTRRFKPYAPPTPRPPTLAKQRSLSIKHRQLAARGLLARKKKKDLLCQKMAKMRQNKK